MTSTVEALQNLYVANGGELTDTYEGICNGAAVGNYVTIPDMINALAELKTANATAETADETDDTNEG